VQSMRGFEDTYRNIIDYIVRITYRIWEDRDVEYIGDTYSGTSRVYDDYGLQLGNQKIIDDTHHTTGAFSDIKLIADEVVWAGDDAKSSGPAMMKSATTHRTAQLFVARMMVTASTDLPPTSRSTSLSSPTALRSRTRSFSSTCYTTTRVCCSNSVTIFPRSCRA
jgi:hypothetical protein